MMQKVKVVESIEQLKELCNKFEEVDCFIALNGGLRSSKLIRYYKESDKFKILNELDGTLQALTPSQLMDEKLTNIGKAIKLGALYYRDKSYDKEIET